MPVVTSTVLLSNAANGDCRGGRSDVVADDDLDEVDDDATAKADGAAAAPSVPESGPVIKEAFFVTDCFRSANDFHVA